MHSPLGTCFGTREMDILADITSNSWVTAEVNLGLHDASLVVLTIESRAQGCCCSQKKL